MRCAVCVWFQAFMPRVVLQTPDDEGSSMKSYASHVLRCAVTVGVHTRSQNPDTEGISTEP